MPTRAKGEEQELKLTKILEDDGERQHRQREEDTLRRIIGKNPTFLAETRKIPLLARCDVSVLICGETGTGKEVVARAIHYLSPRAKNSFLPVNCGAIPPDLMENELFGHERGAFTGATYASTGLVKEADGGTLFLDEIDSMPPFAQVKLLRFLQEKEFRRLGSTRVRHSDVRVIAATNANVEEAMQTGNLRADLYYRLNVVPIKLPPLRERREDIPLLAHHFLHRFARELGRPARKFSPQAMEALLHHDWPGNVRELEHAVQRAVVLAEHQSLLRNTAALLPEAHEESKPRCFKEAKAQVISRFERGYLEEALTAHNGNISHAARAAQKNRRAFWELIRKHRIDVERFKTNDGSAS